MKYYSAKTNVLSGSEARLLRILTSENELSGYEIGARLANPACTEWNSLGSTSVYTGLKKLVKKKLLEAELDTGKKGKGPLPTRYRISEEGREALKAYVFDSLIEGDLRDGRFELALSSLPALGKEAVIQALRKRRSISEEKLDTLKEKFVREGGDNLPFHVVEVFRYAMTHMQVETRYVEELLDKVKRKLR